MSGNTTDGPGRGGSMVIRALYVLCAAALLAEFVIHKHAEHPLESWFGFHAVYGFLAIVVLVLFSKLLRKGVLRPEDYYDD